MWVMIFGILALLSLVGIVFLTVQVHRFSALERLAQKHKLLSWVLAAVPVFCLLLLYFINYFTLFAVTVYLTVIWFVCVLIARIVRKITKRKRTRNIEGAAAICITAALFGIGWYNAHHVTAERYAFTTEKDLGGQPLRIALIADSHIGTTFDGQGFAREMEKIQAEEPDVLLVAGDFTDDDTTPEDMRYACAALGSVKTTYGVYFVFGNHDPGYYRNRGFTAEELRDALTASGVTVMEDTVGFVGGRFCLIGRQDSSAPSRADIRQLTEGLDDGMYQIVLDHQPNDYENEAAAEVDLVLSGHTHGGHLFPAGQIGMLLGINDNLYGTQRRGNTQFLVTSGISGWAIPFKIGTHSEYCIIDVTEA